jgi:signal transduction histidine kinase
MNGWWQQRSLRAQLTLLASTALAVGIAASSLLLLRGFATSRLAAIDATSRTVATNLANLAQAGALPQVLPVEPGQTAQVTAADGGVVAASPGTLRTLPLVPQAKLRYLARGEPTDQPVTSINGEAHSRVRVQAVNTGGATEYVVVASSLADERATLAGLSHAVLIGAPLLLIAVAVTIWLLLGRALRAVDELRRAAEAITDPVAREPLPVPTGRDEIHHLATTLNDMLTRMAAAAERERAFIADTAHELRTPVTAIRTQLEMAVTSGESAATYDFANGALRDAERLSSLVEDLLALARLESTSTISTKPVDLAELAGVDNNEPCIINGDPASLTRAIENLRRNATAHATTVQVTIERVDQRTVALHVDDNGPGVPPADRARVFERLVRLDAARARDDGGSGIGLAIVAATARAHGGTVHVEESPLGGARFTLTLPAVRPPAQPATRTGHADISQTRPASRRHRPSQSATNLHSAKSGAWPSRTEQ